MKKRLTNKPIKVATPIKSGESTNKVQQSTRPNMSKSSDRQTITKMPKETLKKS